MLRHGGPLLGSVKVVICRAVDFRLRRNDGVNALGRNGMRSLAPQQAHWAVPEDNGVVLRGHG